MPIRQLISVLLIVSIPVFAGDDLWRSIQPSGPDSNVGGLVNELAYTDSGSAFLLSSLGYLNYRESNAQPWTRVPVMIDDQSIQLTDLHVGPGDPSVILGKVEFDRLVRSTDGGLNWTELTLPTTNTSFFGWIRGLVTVPTNPNQIYYSTFDQLLMSADGGVSWDVQTNQAPRSMWDMQVHPLDSTLLVATSSGDFVVSVDSGANWEQKTVIDADNFVTLAGLDPTDIQTFYAARNNNLFKSTNGAESWSQVLTLDNDFWIGEITVNPNDPLNVYLAIGSIGEGGIVSTTNGGTSWFESTDDEFAGAYRRVDKNNAGELITGGSAGVNISVDGVNYTRSNAGYNDYYSTSMVVAPSNNNVIYASGQAGGVIVTQDGGQTWNEKNNGIMLTNSWQLAVDPTDSQIAYYAANGGLYKTINGGDLWEKLDLGGSSTTSALSITVAPSDANRLYVRTPPGLITSADGGDSWTLILDGSYFTIFSIVNYPVVVQNDDPSTVYVGTFGGQGLLKSTDAGATWAPIIDQLPNLFIGAVAQDLADSNRVILGLDDYQVVESIDGGENWTNITYNLPPSFGPIAWVAVDPFSRDLYALLPLYSSVYRLPFGQESWQQVGIFGITQNGDRGQLIPSNQIRGRLFVQAKELFSFDLDSDSDGLIDSLDNCVNQANTDQLDSNGDGYGNLCDADLDNNGVVNFLDFGILVPAFLTVPGDTGWNADADFNGDGIINFVDFSIFEQQFLAPPGPSGLQ